VPVTLYSCAARTLECYVRRSGYVKAMEKALCGGQCGDTYVRLWFSLYVYMHARAV